jgi:hypothetical protein
MRNEPISCEDCIHLGKIQSKRSEGDPDVNSCKIIKDRNFVTKGLRKCSVAKTRKGLRNSKKK